MCECRLDGLVAAQLEPDSQILAAQARIDTLMAAESGQGSSRWTSPPLLHDIFRLTRHVISDGDSAKIAKLGEQYHAAAQAIRGEDGTFRCRAMDVVPTKVFAPAVTLALGVLDAADLDAAVAQLADLLPVPTPRGQSTDLQVEMNIWARRSWQMSMLWDRLRAKDIR